MSKAQQNVYVNNIFDAGKTDPDNNLEYEECFASVDKSIYDELSSTQEKGTPSNDSVKMNSMPGVQSKQSDNSIYQKLALLRPMFLILFCILITALVTAITTFFATKNNLSEKKTIHATECSSTCNNDTERRVQQQISHSCSREFCPGNGVHLGVRFSRTELYSSYYMSDDNTTLSNVNTDETSKSASARLLTYRGTISDVCVGDDDLIYYEINYTFSIRTYLTNYFDKEDILEVGIAERSNVDKYTNAGAAASGWSFNMYYTRSAFYWFGRHNVYINARHNGRSHTSQSLLTTSIGEELHGQLKIFINTRRDEFTVMYNDLKVYVFDEIQSNETLCPVFGVYNPNYVNVQLKILNSLNFSMYPW
ncbi:unnamed protein product [Mytilus coruscus]|uniref:Uncharacterized protein n=1 Tax=Mytilus coruscus TaxID=42192 RepID=A0A6J8ABP1_MYTCO|nr:unnamed protein product [Mytilus coruscus]